jgi:hypothetical protein
MTLGEACLTLQAAKSFYSFKLVEDDPSFRRQMQVKNGIKVNSHYLLLQ